MDKFNSNSEPAEQVREKRPSLLISWEGIPWWAVIVIIVGIFVSFSMLTNVRYQDALIFILDLPWHKEVLEDEVVQEDGSWTVTSRSALKPGKYRLYVEFWDAGGEVIDRSDDFLIEISQGALEEASAPITTPGEEYIILDSNLPTLAGEGTPGTDVVLFDDFSRKPLRILVNLWQSEGLFLTLRVTIISFGFALLLGLIFGLMRVADRSPDLRENLLVRLGIGVGLTVLFFILTSLPENIWKIALIFVGVEAFMALLPAVPYTLSTLYVEVIRGLPMLVIVLYMGFAVTPALRNASGNWITGELDLRGIPSAIIGLSIGYGAYLAEVFRGGIESIPKGQMEAARSLGMSYFKAMRFVILPQAVRVILPPLGNDFIAMLKDSSLISVIALPELLQRGRLWISRNFRAFEGYNSVAMMYLLLTLVLSLMVRIIERRTSID